MNLTPGGDDSPILVAQVRGVVRGCSLLPPTAAGVCVEAERQAWCVQVIVIGGHCQGEEEVR